MDIEERNEINKERSEQFKRTCREANANMYNLRWKWKDIGNNMGRMMIYDNYKGKDVVAIWDEDREYIQLMIDVLEFRKNQFIAIGITKYEISVEDGIYGIAWEDEDNMFRSIFFGQKDSSINRIPSTLDELKRLDELDVPEIDEFDVLDDY